MEYFEYWLKFLVSINCLDEVMIIGYDEVMIIGYDLIIFLCLFGRFCKLLIIVEGFINFFFVFINIYSGFLC